MAGNVAGLIADPKFQGLAPADQRAALMGVSGDKTFGTLNDGDTQKFVQAIQARSRPVESPIAPPGMPKPPAVNMQPMSLAQVVNSATGQPNYQPQPITPQGIAKGTAQDLWTLTKAGPQAISQSIFKRPLPGAGPIDTGQVIQAGKNIGQGMLLGAVEGSGVKPRVGEVPQPPVSAEPPAPPAYERPNLTPEQQAKFTSDIDKQNAPGVKYRETQDLAAQKQQQAAVIQQQVKAKNAEVYGGLSQRADAFREASAQVTWPITNIEKTIEQARTELSGVPSDLRIFNQVMDHLQATATEPQAAAFAERLGKGATPEGAAQSLPPSAEVPLVDLQRQYTALSNQWADAEGNVKRVLGDVRNVYQRELQTGAESIGRGDEWRGLQRDFSQYYKDWRSNGPLAKILKAQHPDYVTPQVIGRPGNLLRETYAKYGDPSEIAKLQQIANPPPPPPTPVEPPEPARPVPGPILSHGARLIGKVAGGMVGTALGHPLIGYGVGSELGTEVAKRIAARRVPPTPEAYTRTILEAKEGKLSPGEADRRITRAGGKVKVRPIPTPP